MSKNVLSKIVVCGALSAIAQATCRELCKDGPEFYLLGRDVERLRAVQADLLARGAARCEVLAGDLASREFVGAALRAAEEFLGKSNAFLLCYGSLPNQLDCQTSEEKRLQALNVNFISATSWLEAIAALYESRGAGVIGVISSVAGDRGRQSNYIYGAAKGGLSIYLQGLRNRLFKAGVSVVTIKPGFVDTPMTADIKKGPLFASPEKVAKDIVTGLKAGREVVYTPRFWQGIMLIIRAIPEAVFKRLRL